jgi:PAS domain S-box-containing protein
MMPLVYTLLIVETIAVDLEQYKGYLLANSGNNYCLLTAKSVAEGLELCLNSSIDAILIGRSIASTAGLNLLESLSSNGLNECQSVVILAGAGDVTIAVRAMKLGAHDYIIDRELTPARLQLAIHSAIEQNQPQPQLPAGDRASIDLNFLQSDEQLIVAPPTSPSVLAPSFIGTIDKKSDLDVPLSDPPASRRIPRNLRRLASAAIDPLVAAGYDITDRNRTTAALVESEARFRTLADNISQLVWMADASGWIFWYNRRWFEYTGTTLAQMQGWGWHQVHAPEHLDRVVDRFRAHLASGEPWEDTFPLRSRDGTYRWFLSRAIPIFDEYGNILWWFGTNTDITERQFAQTALEERNRELDSFVHIVAHDLKAPLRAIGNLSEWIEQDNQGLLSPDTQAQITLLRRRVDRLQKTIDGLLDYARVGLMQDRIELVSVSELLIEAIDSLDPPPTFNISIDPNLPILHTKRLLLSQVFANLISNAIKYHDRSGGSVSITAADRGDFYEFAVTDDGPGIDVVYQPNIFTIFQTGNPKTNQDSTGIGLAIVKKIVETETGTIWLRSELGRGSTFSFTWPKKGDRG